MSSHHASVVWRRTSADFAYDSYNRAHEVRFKDGTIVLPGSGAPEFKGDADRVRSRGSVRRPRFRHATCSLSSRSARASG